LERTVLAKSFAIFTRHWPSRAFAGLLIRDLFVALHMNTGLRTEHVLTFGLDLPWVKYSSAQRIVARYQDVVTGLNRVPGVERAAAVQSLPMTGGLTGGSFQIEGRPKATDWVDTLVQYNFVTPGYFLTMGIPLLQGRDFDQRDTDTAMPVAIINDALARQFFADENPIGHRFRDDYDGHWRTIVGIVGSVKNQQPMNPPIPGLYVPHAQEADSRMTVVVRTQGDPAKLATTARSIVHAADADLLIVKMRTMDQVVADSMAEPELLAWFVAGFGAFALLLAAIGIYSIMAYSVSQRTHEMGVRMALGAECSDIFKLVLRRGAVLTVLGIALGIPAAFAASQMIGSLLYGISSHDIAVYTAVLLLLITVSLAAGYFPARRATKADPAAALRSE
jgi:putative ABC transport system permease protein